MVDCDGRSTQKYDHTLYNGWYPHLPGVYGLYKLHQDLFCDYSFWRSFFQLTRMRGIFGTFLLVSRSSPNLLIKRVIFLPSMVDFGECSIQRCIHTLCNGLYPHLPVAYVPYKMHRYILPSYSFWRSFYLVNYTQDISGTFLLLSWYHFSSLIYKLYVIMRTIIYKGFY